MTTTSHAKRLLLQVAKRLHLASFGEQFYRLLLIVSVVFALTLLVVRLCGINSVGPNLGPISLLIIPLVAVVIALLWHRRPTNADAARAIDQQNGSKDLFLTYAMLDSSSGDYQPVVTQEAERQAEGLPAEAVVTWNWSPRFWRCLALAGLLLAGVFYLPQLDPFGFLEAAEVQQQEQAALDKDRVATELRMAQLKEQGATSQESKQTQKAIDELTKSFRQMKRNQPKANLARLNDHQKTMGEQWRKLGAEKLNTLLGQDQLFQDFGGRRQKKIEKWSKELLQGSSDGLQQELSDMQQRLEEMLKESDPVKRSELARQLKEDLRDLSEFASENAGSPELSAALRRAMRQLEAMEKGEPGASEKIEALAKSLDLSKLELRQIAQSAKAMKDLEDALKVTQMAKQLNSEQALDGEGTEAFQSLADYEEYYASLMGQDGSGMGTGGEGFGEGGEAPEDDDVKSEFKTEQEKVAARAGKILLSIKSKGMGDTGEARKEYRDLVNTLKQGVSEAIRQEQVPPGYHDGIRGYFNSIDEPDTESPTTTE